ncbi:hypothetical protein WJ0W_004296 [Paenibacillus melissococcoides]|uniref:Uncharacterized protein n=1 Tax=Paenibacillus melissococcoides TaxID=2912268 RepID=A0ABN8U7H0_9BACL|nr:hypothetical protein WJ0W_004296 [Paenibacillus melissococcoides]
MLQIYIILGPFAPSRRETSEIAAVVQDSFSAAVVPIELLYFCRIVLTESACLEISCSSYADFTCRIDVSRVFPGKLYSFQAVGPLFYEEWRLSIYRIETWDSDQNVLHPFFSTIFLPRDKSKWSAEKSLGRYYVAGEKNPGSSPA